MQKNNFSKLLKIGFRKFSDYYNVLGIKRTASKMEIKKSFIKLAKEYHPDKNPDASKDKFKEITEAYQTLIDIKKKDLYDKKGMSQKDQKIYNNKTDDFDDFKNFWKTHDNENFEDIYNDFDDFFNFTNTKKSKKIQKGEDIRIDLKISFLESIKGIKKKINYTVKKKCKSCEGTKCKPGGSLTKCPICRGKGTKIKRQGPMQFHISCEECEGSGKINKCPCKNCKGKGEGLYFKQDEINIPIGIENNQFLRIRGKGNKGVNGGNDGDLILKVFVEEDDYFKREGLDISTDCSISIKESVLGGVVNVRILNGIEEIEVRKGCNHGDSVRIEGKGVEVDGEKGDHWVIFKVKLPEDLSGKDIKLFEELRDLDNANKEKKNEDKNKINKKGGFYKNFYEKKEAETSI